MLRAAMARLPFAMERGRLLPQGLARDMAGAALARATQGSIQGWQPINADDHCG